MGACRAEYGHFTSTTKSSHKPSGEPATYGRSVDMTIPLRSIATLYFSENALSACSSYLRPCLTAAAFTRLRVTNSSASFSPFYDLQIRPNFEACNRKQRSTCQETLAAWPRVCDSILAANSADIFVTPKFTRNCSDRVFSQ